MKKIYYILLTIIIIGCKENPLKTEIKTSDNHTVSLTEDKVDKSKVQQENCYDYLTELVRSSNFPFKEWDINPNKVNLVIDQDNGNSIHAKLFFETDGTGTIGWIEYNIKERSLLNTSANLEEPEKLDFDLKWSLSIEKCTGIDFDNKPKTISKSLEKVYNDAKEVSLPIQYSYEFLNEEKDFVSLPQNSYPIFKLKEVQNYKIAKLPVYNNCTTVLLEVFQQSGQSELYIVTFDKSFNVVDKIILYTSKEVDEGSLSTTFEITKNYNIKIKNCLLIDEGSGIKEINKKIKNFNINDIGKIVQVN